MLNNNVLPVKHNAFALSWFILGQVLFEFHQVLHKISSITQNTTKKEVHPTGILLFGVVKYLSNLVIKSLRLCFATQKYQSSKRSLCISLNKCSEYFHNLKVKPQTRDIHIHTYFQFLYDKL